MDVQSTARRPPGTVARERGIVALARRQHGVLARRQLLDLGLSVRSIKRRIEAGRMQAIHRGVYALADWQLTQEGRWMAAILVCGPGAILSHRSAAELWGMIRNPRPPIEVTCATAGRGQPGITAHRAGIAKGERTGVGPLSVTTPARALFDLAEVVNRRTLARAAEEGERLGRFSLLDLEAICARNPGRHALRPIRQLIEEVGPAIPTRSPLEDRVIDLCREHHLPLPPQTNVYVLGHEVDAFWPEQKLIIEADSVEFHGHRAAFERDRQRDAARQARGYRVIRLTSRRLSREPAQIAAELRQLLSPAQLPDPDQAQPQTKPPPAPGHDDRVAD